MINLFKKKTKTWESLLSRKGIIPFEHWNDKDRAIAIFFKANHELPSILKYQRDDCDAISAMERIKKEFGITEQGCIAQTDFGAREGDRNFDEIRLMLIKKDLYVLFGYLSGSYGFLIFYSSKTSKELLKKIKDIIISSEKYAGHSVSLISTQAGELVLEDYKIETPAINIATNYNKDFEEVDKIITNSLDVENGKGLILLHGIPGTGKTSYIRHLIATLKKRIVFLPLELAKSIGTPDGISFLSRIPNSVLVIEDAEHILKQRSGESRGTVASTLLNLNDGLLGDCLKIQVICTFNAPLASIDEAFLRKGRLIARYEFKELEVEKCSVLFKQLNITEDVSGKMVLSDIYNLKNRDFREGMSRTKIGFK